MYCRRSECAQDLLDIIRQNVRSRYYKMYQICPDQRLANELYFLSQAVCSILVQQVAQCCPLLSPAAAATAAATAAAATPAPGQTAPVAATAATSIVDACLLAVAPLL
jgi:hypothetical protein